MSRPRYHGAAGFEKGSDAGGTKDVAAKLLPKPAAAAHAINTAGVKQNGLSVQEASQRLTSVVLGLPRHAGIRRTIFPHPEQATLLKFDF